MYFPFSIIVDKATIVFTAKGRGCLFGVGRLEAAGLQAAAVVHV